MKKGPDAKASGPFCFLQDQSTRIGSGCWGKRGSNAAETLVENASGPEKQRQPEQERQAIAQEGAEKKSDGGKDGADALGEGITDLQSGAGEADLKRGAVILDQCEADVCLGDRGVQARLKTLGLGDGFAGLGDIFFQRDSVTQFALVLALEFLEARKIGLRGGETSCSGG